MKRTKTTTEILCVTHSYCESKLIFFFSPFKPTNQTIAKAPNMNKKLKRSKVTNFSDGPFHFTFTHYTRHNIYNNNNNCLHNRKHNKIRVYLWPPWFLILQKQCFFFLHKKNKTKETKEPNHVHVYVICAYVNVYDFCFSVAAAAFLFIHFSFMHIV